MDDLTLLSDNHPIHQEQQAPASSGSDVMLMSPFSVTSSTSGGTLVKLTLLNFATKNHGEMGVCIGLALSLDRHVGPRTRYIVCKC